MSERTLFEIEQEHQFLLDCQPPDDAIEPEESGSLPFASFGERGTRLSISYQE